MRGFECLGACDIAPMASVNGEYVGPLTTDDCKTIVGELLEGREVLAGQAAAPAPVADTLPLEEQRMRSCSSRTSTAPGLNTLKVYEKAGGYESLKQALKMEPEDVLTELQASGVRGRGGAGFAMGKKVSFLPKGTMDKYLVCNADESEPGTFKDRELMQKNPHLLIEGMIIAAWAAGINRSFIYIRGEYEHQADILEAAVAEAARRATSASASSAPSTRSTWSSTAAPAPTSAARRPRCSTRSRASAATRA